MRPEDVFQNIRDLMVFGGNITSIAEVGTTSTLTTDNIGTLKNGMLVDVGLKNYEVSNITRIGLTEWTFDIEAVGVTAISWELALYYEFGRALEVGNTLKDKKQNPANKNKRFPMMWLLTDIPKDENFKIGYQADIVLAFIYLSEKNLKAKKRIDEKFEPILDPLVQLFINTIKKSPGSRYFIRVLGENLDITKTDKFKYGSVDNNKHIFDDISDAIELNMTLRFNREQINCN